jgi:ABC-type multidrug transport system ATPase subunit
VILIDGRVRADGSLDELTGSRTQVVTVAPEDPGRALELFEGLDNVRRVESERANGTFHTFRLHLADSRDVGERVAEIVRQNGWPMRELRRDDKSLEQVFRELTETTEEVAV